MLKFLNVSCICHTYSTKVKGEATIEEAPNTPHFNDAHKLKLPAGSDGDQADVNGLSESCMTNANNENLLAAVPPVPIQGYNVLPTYPQSYYGAPPYPPYYPAPPPQVPTYHPHIPAYYNHYPPPPFPGPYNPFGLHGPAISPQPSPRKAFRLGISLESFCERYGILDSDQDKLVTLEYRPGMPGVEKLNEREWKDLAGFSFLGWESFKDAHKQFLKDVHDGK